MDNSTDGVTLYAGFIFDVLSQYKGMEKVCGPAFDLAAGLDPNQPLAMVPIKIYNDICRWIEERLGAANIRQAGRAIGARAYDEIVKNGALGKSPAPSAILRELKRVASVMIQDPKGRGWEILDENERSVLMRRTQSFNCALQEGLLVSLIEKTGVLMPAARHVRCTQQGAEFCDYEVTWLNRRLSK